MAAWSVPQTFPSRRGDAQRPRWNRLGLWVALVLLGTVVLASPARAQLAACPADPGADGTLVDAAAEVRELRREQVEACEAVTERLDAIEATGEATVTALEALADSAEDPSAPAQRVRLSVADRNRLDLSWWGAWAIVGLLLAQIVVVPMIARFHFGRG